MTEKLPLEEIQRNEMPVEELHSENLQAEQESNQPQSFQNSITELKSIVEQLENVQGDLDQSIKLFKRGMVLAKWSEEYLMEMEEQITDIINQSKID
ncbi:MAG TPA: exodeoxyribonuclease VII small subunit [Clostridiaceae bacterium]|nr:exodeoxyribonuclease VII small subunit [Clostridiaceae bacterium]